MEEWRPIEGWPYEVSSLGNIRNARGQLLKPKSQKGYRRVTLCRPDKRQDHMINRLVATTFLRPPQGSEEADHINRNRSDDRLENIRWLSVAANRANRLVHAGESHANAKLTAAAVAEIRRLSNPQLDKKFAASLGCSRESVRDARNWKTWRV